MIQIRDEVISTHVLERIRFGQDLRNSICLRVEVLRSMASGKYSCKIFRSELFRIKPTFQEPHSSAAEESDEMLLVEDDSLIGAELDAEYDTRERALESALLAIGRKFNLAKPE